MASAKALPMASITIHKGTAVGASTLMVKDRLKLQVQIRGEKSPFGRLAADALAEIEQLEANDAFVREYNELIVHMDAGGDFFTFQASKMAKDSQ